MMQLKTARFATILFAFILLWGLGNQVSAQEKKKIALEDIWLRYKFMPQSPSQFNWMKDDNFYTELEEKKIEKYSIKDQKKEGTILDISTLKDPNTNKALDVSNYSFNGDESKILLTGNIEPIYRRSTKEVSYVWDSKSGKVFLLQDGEQVSFATFSPDGNRIAYMYKNNLYALDFVSGKRYTITTDGEWNKIINGGCDWVYEEEFGFAQAFMWAPDSKRLAFYRFDESHVKEFSMTMYGELYPEEYKFKYPKAGEANAFVDIVFYEFETGKRITADINQEKDQYIPRIKWTADATKLAVMRMNRLQNLNEILMVDARNGEGKVILREQEDTYVEQPGDNTWHFLADGKQFLWQSERDGFNHVYLYTLEGKLVRQITSGKFDVTEICAIDEKAGKIFYLSTQDSPMERHLYATRLDGKKSPEKLTNAEGWHSVSFSSSNTYYMDSYSSINSVPYAALYDQKGKEVKMLKDNSALKQLMGEYDMSQAEFFDFKTEEGSTLNGWMIKPSDFDASKKYPVLMHVYGGPGSQTVKNDFLGFNFFWHQMLAQKGYIVVSIDNRGTGGRGEEFKKCTYGQLGKKEAEDQIAGAKYLGSLNYVDKDRIGIWGWSFGGYMTSLCLATGEGIFKMGIAVAPVTTWRFYDTIYTERYLKTPQLNPSGYDDNSPIKHAKTFSGNYLLVHGTADDNVHFQNSVEWSNALINANKPFDMAYYPNKNHGIYGGYTRFHLYNKMTNFVLTNL